MAGNTAASNLDSFAYVALNSFSQAAITFTGQNVGADRWDRVKKVLGACSVSILITALVVGAILLTAGESLLWIYDDDARVIEAGMVRLVWMATTYFLCGFMDTLVGMLRGMGRSVLPMLVSLAGACGLRIVWIYTVFVLYHELWVVYASYPVTWTITALTHLICFVIIYRKQMKLWHLRRQEAVC